MEKEPVDEALQKSLKETADYKQALKEQQALFNSIINSSDDAIISKSLDGIITSWNHGAEKIFGYTAAEIIGKHLSLLIPPHRQNEEKLIIEKIRKGEFVHHYETERVRKDGQIIHVSLSVSPVKDAAGNIIGASKISRDITERKKAEVKIIKANRLYAFLSQVNQGIVHIENSKELTDRVCEIAVEIGQFKTAWIGLLDEKGLLQMVSLRGDKQFIEQLLKYSGMDFTQPELRDTTTGVMLRTGEYVIKNDVQNDPSMKLLKEAFVSCGIKATVSFPIKKFGKVIGVFGLTSGSDSEDFFDANEIELLEEAANDISFALENFEKEKQRRQAEANLEQSERELNSAHARLLFHIENTPLGFIEWDSDLKIISLSKRAKEIFGWSLKDFNENRRTGLAQVYVEDLPLASNIAEQLLSGEVQRNTILHRNYTKDGKVIWCEWFNSVMKDEKGKINTIVSLVQDVTKRKQTEEDLLHSERRLKEAQAISHIGNWQIDLLTGINTWSDEFYKIFGINMGEIEPSPESFLSLIHPEDFNYAKEKVEEALKTFENSSFYARMNSKNDNERHFYTEWRFEFDKNKKPTRLYGIVQDITERKIAEEEREKMIADMLQRNRDLEQFAFIVSHNLRAPTANILGFAENLKNETLTPEEEKQLLDGLLTSVVRLDLTIRDINKILQVKHEANDKKELIGLSKLVNDISISITNLILKHHVKIETDFSQIDDIYSLKGYIHSIFYNLISNSIKYSKPDEAPIIEIKSSKINGKTLLTFKDNGLGIDLKANGDKIFGLYKRFHSHVEGKGIGLFMVKTQVEALGGTITINSEPGKGTEFKIEI